MALVTGLLVGACGGTGADMRQAAQTPKTASRVVHFDGAPALPAMAITASGDSHIGTVDDSSTGGGGSRRLLIRSPRDPMTVQRLCGVIASGVARPTVVDWGMPVDTTRPPLAARLVTGTSVRGLRFLLPGDDAKYVFEGVGLSGDRVSLHWPVRSELAIPVGAPDSVIERAVLPTAPTLDSLVASLRIVRSPGSPEAAEPTMPLTPPHREAAVLLDGVIPRYDVALSSSCMDVTYALPVVARVDTRLRLVVPPGATVEAVASVADGAVRVAFEEAPVVAEPRTRESVPSAAIIAGASGVVTLRVRLQVVPRAQAAGQLVLVRLRATADRGADR